MPLNPRLVREAARFASLVGALAVVGSLTACARSQRIATTAPAPGDSTALRLLDAESRAAIRRGAIGVPPFATSGSDSTLVPLAFALADLVATDLSRSARVNIVERSRLGEVLRELDLASSGRVDSASAPRVGRLVSAERLIFGSVEPLDDGRTIRIGARIGEVTTGVVMTAVDARAPLAEIFAAEKALVLRLFEQMGITLTPRELARIQQEPTRNLAALLAYGRGVQRTYDGDYKGAAQAFRESYRLDPGFTGARTREVESRAINGSGTAVPVAVPGVRALDGAISTAVDRINRPLDLVTNVSRSVSNSADPAFPGTVATIVITISRP
jgi:TolB-like protein